MIGLGFRRTPNNARRQVSALLETTALISTVLIHLQIPCVLYCFDGQGLEVGPARAIVPVMTLRSFHLHETWQLHSPSVLFCPETLGGKRTEERSIHQISSAFE